MPGQLTPLGVDITVPPPFPINSTVIVAGAGASVLPSGVKVNAWTEQAVKRVAPNNVASSARISSPHSRQQGAFGAIAGPRWNHQHLRTHYVPRLNTNRNTCSELLIDRQ
jgi:hypothetical protein